MKRKIIGLMGVKGCGKDTFAAILVKQHGFVRIGFADELYRQVAQTYGVTVEFLGERTTKETDLPELALSNCKEPGFVQCVLETLGWDNTLENLEKPLSPRTVLQLWGTEFRRLRGQDSYWLDIVARALKDQPERSFVVTDVRFPNEMKFMKDEGATLVRVRRPAQEEREAKERLQNGRATHASETALANAKADVEVFNVEGQPEAMAENANALVSAPLEFA